ncbi:MAG: hypothetical protein GXP26_14225 [Planctomycetes bacterium]|nr:hypothetical protein [Planctomycetota bacterium]
MAPYFKYVCCGLILMAPQELIVSIFKGMTFTLFLMSLVFWSVALSVMFGLSKLTRRLIKHQGSETTLSAIFYMTVGFSVEWGLLGNSPWSNPGANQLGLVAGWVSVFILPRVFLEDNFQAIRKWIKIWYLPFVASLFLPVLLIPEKGPIIGVTVYGYSVIPFLLISVWYCCAKWQARQTTAK